MDNSVLKLITKVLRPVKIAETGENTVTLQLPTHGHPLVVQATPFDPSNELLRVSLLWLPLIGQGAPIPVGQARSYIHGVAATPNINEGYLRHKVDLLLASYPHDYAQADAQRSERAHKTQEYNDTKALLLQTFEGRGIFAYEKPNRKYFAVEVGPWKVYVVWGISGYGIKLVEDVSVEQVLKSLEAFSG